VGKAGDATRSLYVRCGSAVIRQIVVVGDVFRGCGTAILEGLRRLWSTMCFFVVSVSHIGGEVESSSSSESASSLMRLFLPAAFVFSISEDLMCFRSALEALRV
jgi:hypothetical protein